MSPYDLVDSEKAEFPVTESGVGRRYNLCLDGGGLGLPRRPPRRVFAARRRLGAAQVVEPRLGPRRVDARAHATQAATWTRAHNDRGCQYASREYRDVLEQHSITCSMSAAGDCYDNAVAESFFAPLEKELVHGCAFETRTEAYDAFSDYIENYYTAKRRHSAAGKLSPVNFERAHVGQLAA